MNKLHSYDLETGAVVWHSQGLTMNPIPSPVGEDGIVIATSGFRGNNLKAIRIADAKGDHHRLERDRLVARSRHAVRAVAASLRRLSVSAEEQLADSVGVRRKDRQAALSASAARRAVGSIFIPGRCCRPRVHYRPRWQHARAFATAASFEVLAKNVLDDGFDASPALVDNEMYMRGYRYLYSLGAK